MSKKKDDVGEKEADFFYPISIIEKEMILNECKRIGICGICSIASDLAVTTVNYVSSKMGLTGNSIASSILCTNKYNMRNCFKNANLPIPNYILVDNNTNLSELDFAFPSIVKPVDRSGSRGITKVKNKEEMLGAVKKSLSISFSNKVIVEDYIEGEEFSVEYISWQGNHHYLATTKKYTTGAPHFIETGHLEPAPISDEINNKIKTIVEKSLTALQIEYGASHSEVIVKNGEVYLIEIGARMGGDFIGSDLVFLSTGYDFVKAVIDVSVGLEPAIPTGKPIQKAIVSFELDSNTTDSSNRIGYSIKTERL